jgi:hypothetical protein
MKTNWTKITTEKPNGRETVLICHNGILFVGYIYYSMKHYWWGMLDSFPGKVIIKEDILVDESDLWMNISYKRIIKKGEQHGNIRFYG